MATSPSDALRARAAKLGYPIVDLAQIQVSPSILELVPEWVARQNMVLPVAIEGEVLRLAAAEPPTPETLDRLRHVLKRAVAVALAEGDLGATIELWYREAAFKGEATVLEPHDEEPIDFMEVAAEEESTDAGQEMLDPDDPRVVQVVQAVIAEALRLGASRILILPAPRKLKVAYRVQDAACSREELPARLLHPILAKLMTMANLHGFIKVVTGKRERRLRMVIRPAKFGLSAVLETTPDASVVEVSRAKAAKLGYSFVALDEPISPGVLALVPAETALEEKILPIALEGKVLTLVMGDAPSPDTLDRLGFLLNCPLAVALAPAGRLWAAIEQYYGPSDPELLDPSLWEPGGESQQAAAGAPDELRLPELSDTPAHVAARPLADHLRTFCRPAMLELFEAIGASDKLCRQEPVSGNLQVVLPYSQVVSHMPAPARRYLDNKVWALREAIVSRLDSFLERDGLARAVAMTYALYRACCRLAQGRIVSINPATRRDAWINFAYAMAIRSFPSVDSNGALLTFLTEHLDQLSGRIASLVDDAALVCDPAAARPWLARLARQTVTDEAMDFDSPPIMHLLELLIAEAVHLRASGIAIVPLGDRVEVAYRIQRTVYSREGLPLRRLYPLLARLRALAELSGKLRVSVGSKERHLRVRLRPTDCGLSAVIDIAPDVSAAEICKAQAAQAGYAFVQLEAVQVPGSLLGLIPKAMAWKKTVLPLEVHDSTLTVVVPAPPTPRRLDELRLIFNNPLSLAMAPEDEILAAIYRHYHPTSAEPAASPAALSLLSP